MLLFAMIDSGYQQLALTMNIGTKVMVLRRLVEMDYTGGKEQNCEDYWRDLVRCVVIDAALNVATHFCQMLTDFG